MSNVVSCLRTRKLQEKVCPRYGGGLEGECGAGLEGEGGGGLAGVYGGGLEGECGAGLAGFK